MLISQIDVSFCHVYREGNCVANYLANAGANGSNCIYSSQEPLWLNILCYDWSPSRGC